VSAAELWGLLGVLLGGAIPWLEAVVVIPAGIIAGLPAVPVILAGESAPSSPRSSPWRPG